MSQQPRVWVVEVEFEPSVWVPITACGLTREDARGKLERNATKYAEKRFRVSEYARQEPEYPTDPGTPEWRKHWPGFESVIKKRLDKGAIEYGHTSLTRPVDEIVGEIEEELLDVIGWAFMAWIKMERARKGGTE